MTVGDGTMRILSDVFAEQPLVRRQIRPPAADGACEIAGQPQTHMVGLTTPEHEKVILGARASCPQPAEGRHRQRGQDPRAPRRRPSSVHFHSKQVGDSALGSRINAFSMICRTREERVTSRRRASCVSVAWSSAGNLTLRTLMGGWCCIQSLNAIREYIIYFSYLMSHSSNRKVLTVPASISDTNDRTAPVVYRGQAWPCAARGTQPGHSRCRCG